MTGLPIDIDESTEARIAILDPAITEIAHDKMDRKWVAAGLAHQEMYNKPSPIMYAAESDWYAMEEPLSKHGIEFIRLLPDAWYEAKLARDA